MRAHQWLGSTWTTYGVYVGNSGSGTLSITNGGSVWVATEAYVRAAGRLPRGNAVRRTTAER